MKIALLGDVHANLPALEAVLEHASERGVDAIWNIGDFVGYGAFPNQVINLLRERKAISIAGNYDLKVLRFPEKMKKWRKSKRLEKWLAFQWAYQQLTPESRSYLAALPEQMRLQAAGWRVLLTHASPVSNEEYLKPDTPLDRLRQLADIAQADIVVCGHSHQPFARRAGDVWFINTGSVGRPDDGDPRACYALLELDYRSLDVEHFRLAYDLERAAHAIHASGMPQVFATMIRSGRDLDTILKMGGAS